MSATPFPPGSFHSPIFVISDELPLQPLPSRSAGAGDAPGALAASARPSHRPVWSWGMAGGAKPAHGKAEHDAFPAVGALSRPAGTRFPAALAVSRALQEAALLCLQRSGGSSELLF